MREAGHPLDNTTGTEGRRTSMSKAEPLSLGTHEPLEDAGKKAVLHVLTDGGTKSFENEEGITDSSCIS